MSSPNYRGNNDGASYVKRPRTRVLRSASSSASSSSPYDARAATRPTSPRTPTAVSADAVSPYSPVSPYYAAQKELQQGPQMVRVRSQRPKPSSSSKTRGSATRPRSRSSQEHRSPYSLPPPRSPSQPQPQPLPSSRPVYVADQQSPPAAAVEVAGSRALRRRMYDDAYYPRGTGPFPYDWEEPVIVYENGNEEARRTPRTQPPLYYNTGATRSSSRDRSGSRSYSRRYFDDQTLLPFTRNPRKGGEDYDMDAAAEYYLDYLGRRRQEALGVSDDELLHAASSGNPDNYFRNSSYQVQVEGSPPPPGFKKPPLRSSHLSDSELAKELALERYMYNRRGPLDVMRVTQPPEPPQTSQTPRTPPTVRRPVRFYVDNKSDNYDNVYEDVEEKEDDSDEDDDGEYDIGFSGGSKSTVNNDDRYAHTPSPTSYTPPQARYYESFSSPESEQKQVQYNVPPVPPPAPATLPASFYGDLSDSQEDQEITTTVRRPRVAPPRSP